MTQELSIDAQKIVSDFSESWSISDEAAKALVGVVSQVCRDQTEADARIAESFQYSTQPNPYYFIARKIRREAGIVKERRKRAVD